MRKFRLVDLKFDGYPDPRVFSDWLANMEFYCDCYEMSNMCKIQFARIRLVEPVRIYWTSIETARERQHKNLIKSWEGMNKQG